jgi:hypothetical protein
MAVANVDRADTNACRARSAHPVAIRGASIVPGERYHTLRQSLLDIRADPSENAVAQVQEGSSRASP